MNPKQRAAEAAVELLQSGMIVGLGTGSTAEFFHDALARQIQSGKLKDIRGVPTSLNCEQRARKLGIPLTSLSAGSYPDITVDGADQIAPNLDAIKGLGGALLREKIVAENSKRMVLIADSGKLVTQLGNRTALPVEVIPFEHESHVPFLRALGCRPELRKEPDGRPFISDNGNYIYHCLFDRIDDPAGLDRAIKARAGIVETGLFVGIASLAIVASENQVRHVQKP